MKTNVNSKYGFGSSSIYTNVDGETVNIQIQYLKGEIEKYDAMILDLRRQLQSLSSSRNSTSSETISTGTPQQADQLQFQAITNKLADAINQQTRLKQSLDAANVQRDMAEQEKIAAAQSGAISNKLGVPSEYGSSAPPNKGLTPSYATKTKSATNSHASIFGLLIIAAAAYGAYKFFKK